MVIIAYKLFRELKSGEITSLFINKSRRLPYNRWMDFENYPTKGFAERPGWHCTAQPIAPHLKMKLKSGEVRVWKKVLIEDYTEVKRPENQGGLWYLAKRMIIMGDEWDKLITNTMEYHEKNMEIYSVNTYLKPGKSYFQLITIQLSFKESKTKYKIYNPNNNPIHYTTINKNNLNKLSFKIEDSNDLIPLYRYNVFCTKEFIPEAKKMIKDRIKRTLEITLFLLEKMKKISENKLIEIEYNDKNQNITKFEN